jgi:pimeloyl-ACP methyl ester carboxylesterase
VKAVTRFTVSLDTGSTVVLADSGPPTRAVGAVALPGWKGADIGLRRIVARAVESGRRVVTVNLPGMGVSDSTGRLDGGLAELCELVEQVLGRLDPPEPVVLVGHSFGGTIAMAVAGRQRIPLRGLVLASPVVMPPRNSSALGGRAGNACAGLFAAVMAGAPRRVADAVCRSTLLEDLGNACLTRHGLRGFLRIRAEARPERDLRPDPRVAAEQLRLAARHGCLEFAPDVRVPVRIVAGDRDQLSPASDLSELSDALPRARMRLLAGAGHLAHQEDAQAFSDLVVECLADLAST